MMKIFVLDDEILGGAWPSNDDGLNILEVWKPVRTSVLGRPFEEIMRRFFDEAFKR